MISPPVSTQNCPLPQRQRLSRGEIASDAWLHWPNAESDPNWTKKPPPWVVGAGVTPGSFFPLLRSHSAHCLHPSLSVPIRSHPPGFPLSIFPPHPPVYTTIPVQPIPN